MAALLVPGVLAWLHQSLRTRRWGRGIRVGATAAAFSMIGITAVLLIGWPRSSIAGLPSLRFSLAPVDLFRLFLFSLWFGLAMRLLQVSRYDGDTRTSALEGPRSASPASRSGVSPVSAGSWRFLWGIWWYGVVAVVAAAGPSRVLPERRDRGEPRSPCSRCGSSSRRTSCARPSSRSRSGSGSAGRSSGSGWRSRASASVAGSGGLSPRRRPPAARRGRGDVCRAEPFTELAGGPDSRRSTRFAAGALRCERRRDDDVQPLRVPRRARHRVRVVPVGPAVSSSARARSRGRRTGHERVEARSADRRDRRSPSDRRGGRRRLLRREGAAIHGVARSASPLGRHRVRRRAGDRIRSTRRDHLAGIRDSDDGGSDSVTDSGDPPGSGGVRVASLVGRPRHDRDGHHSPLHRRHFVLDLPLLLFLLFPVSPPA